MSVFRGGKFPRHCSLSCLDLHWLWKEPQGLVWMGIFKRCQLNASLVGTRFFPLSTRRSLCCKCISSNFLSAAVPWRGGCKCSNFKPTEKSPLFFLFTFLWLHRNSPLTCQAPWPTGYKPLNFRKHIGSEAMKITLVTLLVASGLWTSEAPPRGGNNKSFRMEK